MDSEWKTYRLDELCDFTNGYAFKSTDYLPRSNNTLEVFRMGYIQRGGGFQEDSTPVFVSRNYGKDLERFLLQPGDVTIAMTDMKDRVAILGNTALIKDSNRFVLNQRVGCIRVKRSDLLDPRFLYFYSNTSSQIDYLRSRANSGVQVNLSTSTIKESPLTIPPLPVQKSIAALLGALDDRIENLRQTNATLQDIASALFKSWFVDFDSVPPEDMKESELGLIPKGWRVGTLGDCCENIRKQAPPGSLSPATPYIGLEHMPRKSIALTECGTSEGLASGKFWYQRNDILFGKLRPYFHKVGVASNEGVCSTDILVIRPKPDHWLGFMAMHLFSDALVSYATQVSNGAKMPRTNWSDIAGYKVVLPPVEEATKFNDAIRPLIEKLHTNIEVAATLALLRDTLLPCLISGRLRISNAARQIVEVTA